MWLRNRWTEKDHLLEHFSRTGRFPAGKPWEGTTPDKLVQRSTATRAAKTVITEIKPNNLREFLAIFAPVAAFTTALMLFYGASETVLMSVQTHTHRPDATCLQAAAR